MNALAHPTHTSAATPGPRLAGRPASRVASVIRAAGLEAQQRRWIFQAGWQRARPTAAAVADAADDRWIDVHSEASRGPARLHARWLSQADPHAPAMLYLHGARHDLGASEARMRHWHRLGFSVLGVDYRGFGRSTALLPSEASVLEDAGAAWSWLSAQRASAPRFVYGHSLGGAIAIQLAAAEHDLSGLIVEGTFTSVPDVYGTLRWGWLPLAPLITQRFDSAQHVRRVRAPLLVVHGSDDRAIRPSLGRALYENATSPKRFVLVPGATHHDAHLVGEAMYRPALRELFSLP